MKKIIALALALIMALSMASVAFAAYASDKTFYVPEGTKIEGDFAPGTKLVISFDEWTTAAKTLSGYKVSTNFTEAAKDYKGASLVDGVKILKDKAHVELTLKESYTATAEKELIGEIILSKKNADTYTIDIDIDVNNNVEEYVAGAKKASEAEDYVVAAAKDTVRIMDEDGGYIYITDGDSLSGVVKVAAEEKFYFNADALTGDALEALEEYLGEDYDAIWETYSFETRAFKNEVDFRYDAYEEDPHYFYKWDGEKMVAIDAKYDADEEVDDYVFTTTAEDTIFVTDVELVLAEEETKNPDTGANDVVGVAAALAVVSLVAAGAVSLKK